MKSTTDYSKFQQIDGNRRVNKGHVNKLVEAIERKNLLQYFPILLNEKGEVIDGQHRLHAAAILDVPIYYETVNGLTLTDVMSINTNSKSWIMNDFIESHIELGNENYKVLKDFIDEFHWNPSTAASLLGGYTEFMRGSGMQSKKIKNGEFKVASLGLAEKIARQIQELRHQTDFNGSKDREFIGALLNLNANKDFDFEQFSAKVRMRNLVIEKRPSTKYYTILIEELYNHGVSKNFTELYKSTQDAIGKNFK